MKIKEALEDNIYGAVLLIIAVILIIVIIVIN